MRGGSFAIRSACAAALSFVVGQTIVANASAQTVEQFYKTHTLTIISSSGAGGGYDTYSRVLAQFLVKYIPGHPRIVVQNMEGADGLTAINYIANQAPKDGSVIADAFGTMPIYPLVDGRNAQFDSRTINWLGSISTQVSVCIAWRDSSFKTLDDVFKRSMRVAGTGATGWRAIMPRLYNLVAGSKFDVITGYATGADYIAVERGEVDGTCTTYDTLSATKIDWINQKKIKFIAQFGEKPLPGLESVPMGLDRIQNKVDLAAMRLVLSEEQTGRPYMAPPRLPADRLTALRAAFDATMKDPDFIALAAKTHLSLSPMTGKEMEDLIEKSYATPPDVVARARTLLKDAVPR